MMRKIYVLIALMLTAGYGYAAAASDDNVDTLNLKNCKAQGFDKAGVPNEFGSDITKKLKDEATTKEEIYAYFSHYSPVIRHHASQAMFRQGKEAMPLLSKALKSGDRYKIRAACDAISQFRGFFGVNVNPGKDGTYKNGMTREMNAEAVPYLAPLLDHKDMNVRMGALMALSRCGKAAAPHLAKSMTFLTDEDQWMRGAAVYVLQGVGSPEADKYLPAVAKARGEEIHVQPLNIMSAAMKSIINTCADKDKVLVLMGKELKGMFHEFHRSRGTAVLAAAGPDAKVALGYLDKIIKKDEKLVAKDPEAKGIGDVKWELKDMQKAREKIVPTPKEK